MTMKWYRTSNCAYGFRCSSCNKYNNADSKKIFRLRKTLTEKVEKWRRLEEICNGSTGVYD